VERRGARLIVAGCITLLGALELEGLARVLQDHAELWRRVREEVEARREAITAVLAAGRPLADVENVLPPGVAGELEVFNDSGVRMQAHPVPSGLSDWPTGTDLARIRRGTLLTRPVAGPPARIVSYLVVPWMGRPAILRIVSPMVDPILEPADRVPVLRHGAALLLLLVVALFVLVDPGAEPGVADPGTGALRAYEEAMGRLQAQGEARSLHHEQETQRLRSKLDDKDAMARAGELTSGIVHEVRNGLGTIAGYARLIERTGTGEPAESARQIREECATLETVVRRFVDFVRSEDLRLAPFDLGRMLARVAAREGRSRTGAAVVLPEPLPDLALVGDEEMLERAFENLVRNARAAAGEDGHVWIDIAQRAEDVIVAVADDGPGMPAEQRAAIRPFTSSKGGLGLGLATALKIVQLHGGELVLGERRPHGVEAAVRLPRAFAGHGSGVT
jgi:signal transduction histidine kinase